MKILSYIAIVFFSVLSLSCSSDHASTDADSSVNPAIQATYGVRNAYEVASYLGVVTGVKVFTETNNNVSGVWTTKSGSLCGVGTLNAKCVQALFDVSYRVFQRVVALEAAQTASSRKFFGQVTLGGNINQFTAQKKASVAETLLLRLMGRNPTAEEIDAVTQTFTAILAVAPAPTTNQAVTILAATVAASTLGGSSH